MHYTVAFGSQVHQRLRSIYGGGSRTPLMFASVYLSDSAGAPTKIRDGSSLGSCFRKYFQMLKIEKKNKKTVLKNALEKNNQR